MWADPETGQPAHKYVNQLQQIANGDRVELEVDLDDLADWRSAPQLFHHIA